MSTIALGIAQRIDWFSILIDLQLRGYTNARVARRLGVAKNTVHGWKMGAHPAHALGEALLALHQEVTSHLPVMPPPKPKTKRVRKKRPRKRERVLLSSN